MLKQLASASIPAWYSLTLLVLPSPVAPLTLDCAYVAAFFFEYEISLRDTTSAINILNLYLRFFSPSLLQSRFFLTKL